MAESDRHKTIKSEIYQGLIEKGYQGQTEYPFKNAYGHIVHRPDLLFSIKGQLVAIEIQCSPISRLDIQSRNLHFTQNHIAVLWVIGSNDQNSTWTKYIAKHVHNDTLFYHHQKAVLRSVRLDNFFDTDTATGSLNESESFIEVDELDFVLSPNRKFLTAQLPEITDGMIEWMEMNMMLD